MYTDASKYQERWDAFAKACDDFYNKLQQEGKYQLEKLIFLPTLPRQEKVAYYRLAYRRGYYLNASTEVLHTVRVPGNDMTGAGRYCWHSSYSSSLCHVMLLPYTGVCGEVLLE